MSTQPKSGLKYRFVSEQVFPVRQVASVDSVAQTMTVEFDMPVESAAAATLEVGQSVTLRTRGGAEHQGVIVKIFGTIARSRSVATVGLDDDAWIRSWPTGSLDWPESIVRPAQYAIEAAGADAP